MTIIVALVSVIVTVVVVAGDSVDVRSSIGATTLVEVAAILAVLVWSARRAGAVPAVTACVLGAVSVGLTGLRFSSPGDAAGDTFAGVAVWTLVAVLASLGGAVFRTLDDRRARAVSEAQRAQRLLLARDLHDFVAHDISEMLALAQAGQVLAADQPQLASTFSSIDQAAQRALGSMDRTLVMLHQVTPGHDLHDIAGGERSHPTVEGVAELARRFTGSSAVPVDLDVEPPLTWHELKHIPSEASAALYRVAVEALTNVRRHASAAQTVAIRFRSAVLGDDPETVAVELTVADDAPHYPAKGQNGLGRQLGFGLPALADRVGRLGGRLTAGPRHPAGWAVTATVPRADNPARGREGSGSVR